MTESNLYYEVHGDRGPFLLLVHGLLSSRAQWMPNVSFLSEFCRPVVVELWGHGRSPSPKDPQSYTPDHYSREFEKIRSIVDTERWYVCGQSLGAALTLRYARYHPERFTAQIFTNSRSALSETAEGRSMKMIEKRLETEGRNIIDNSPLNPSRSSRLPPDMKNALLSDIDLIDLEGYKNTLLYTIPQSSVRNILHQIKVPTLMIAGRYDRAFSDLQDIAIQSIPNLQVQIFEGGHAVNIDAADEFNLAVKAFITKF